MCWACTKDKALKPEDADPIDCNDISYTNDVLPVIRQNCSVTGCHDVTTSANDIVLESYTDIRNESGDPRFLESIKFSPGVTGMPFQSNRLDEDDIQRIECWIESGRPQN